MCALIILTLAHALVQHFCQTRKSFNTAFNTTKASTTATVTPTPAQVSSMDSCWQQLLASCPVCHFRYVFYSVRLYGVHRVQCRRGSAVTCTWFSSCAVCICRTSSVYTTVINSSLKHSRKTSDGTMHHGNRAAGGQVVFFMTNRLSNPSYGTHHDPERAYLTEQRMQVDSVDRPFDCGFVDVKVPAVSCPVVTWLVIKSKHLEHAWVCCHQSPGAHV